MSRYDENPIKSPETSPDRDSTDEHSRVYTEGVYDIISNHDGILREPTISSVARGAYNKARGYLFDGSIDTALGALESGLAVTRTDTMESCWTDDLRKMSCELGGLQEDMGEQPLEFDISQALTFVSAFAGEETKRTLDQLTRVGVDSPDCAPLLRHCLEKVEVGMAKGIQGGIPAEHQVKLRAAQRAIFLEVCVIEDQVSRREPTSSTPKRERQWDYDVAPSPKRRREPRRS